MPVGTKLGSYALPKIIYSVLIFRKIYCKILVHMVE
jgi:hypothetical protein